jgi:hypothetical protein
LLLVFIVVILIILVIKHHCLPLIVEHDIIVIVLRLLLDARLLVPQLLLLRFRWPTPIRVRLLHVSLLVKAIVLTLMIEKTLIVLLLRYHRFRLLWKLLAGLWLANQFRVTRLRF